MREPRGGAVAVDLDDDVTSEAYSSPSHISLVASDAASFPTSGNLRRSLASESLRSDTSQQRRLKRGMDLVVSSALLLLLSPLLFAIAVAVRLDSRGPILFRQERVGKGGRPFPLYKFRSMEEDAEAALHADPVLRREYLGNGFKLPADGDPRVTRLGRFLRRSSLDELPQLLNVLRGDMSLVGPRPVVREELAWYGAEAHLLLAVRPGITGLWQVSGRNKVGYPRRASLELEYVLDWSLRKDLEILLRTPRAVLEFDG